MVKFGRSARSPAPEDSSVALRAEHPSGPSRLYSEVIIHGSVAPALLPERPPAKDEPSSFLSVMAIGSRKRVFRWHSVELPNESIERRECFFELNLGLLVDQTDPPQKAFVIAVMGTTKSEVMVVDPMQPAPRAAAPGPSTQR